MECYVSFGDFNSGILFNSFSFILFFTRCLGIDLGSIIQSVLHSLRGTSMLYRTCYICSYEITWVIRHEFHMYSR